jgi:hypothetical protein
MKKFDQNIGFWEKRQFFAENCDHNIDPLSGLVDLSTQAEIGVDG